MVPHKAADLIVAFAGIVAGSEEVAREGLGDLVLGEGMVSDLALAFHFAAYS